MNIIKDQCLECVDLRNENISIYWESTEYYQSNIYGDADKWENDITSGNRLTIVENNSTYWKLKEDNIMEMEMCQLTQIGLILKLWNGNGVCMEMEIQMEIMFFYNNTIKHQEWYYFYNCLF